MSEASIKAEKILDNLSSRSGFGNVLDLMDITDREELKSELVEIIEKTE